MAYTRKLQKIGESLFVSLPKSWIDQVQLHKGDLIALIEQADSVLIQPITKSKKEDIRQIVINVDGKESIRSLKRRIVGAYVDGFDVIQLQAENKFAAEQQDTIREITTYLFGLEIFEVKSNLVTIQCLLTKTLPIESTFQRLHSIITSIFNEIIIALKERTHKEAINVIERMYYVQRFSLVLHRLLRSLILFPIERTPDMKLIDSVDFLKVVSKITEISKNIKTIAESIALFEPPIPEAIRESLLVIFHKILESFDHSIQALMTKNVFLANRVFDIDMEEKFNELWEYLLKAEENEEITVSTFSYIHRILDNLKQINTYTLETAEIAIYRAEELS